MRTKALPIALSEANGARELTDLPTIIICRLAAAALGLTRIDGHGDAMPPKAAEAR